jgi:hypothetical protein
MTNTNNWFTYRLQQPPPYPCPPPQTRLQHISTIHRLETTLLKLHQTPLKTKTGATALALRTRSLSLVVRLGMFSNLFIDDLKKLVDVFSLLQVTKCQ